MRLSFLLNQRTNPHLPSLVWFPDPFTHKIRACAYYACACEKEGSGTEPGGVGHDHVCAIFADSAPSNVCEFSIIGDRGISADIC